MLRYDYLTSSTAEDVEAALIAPVIHTTLRVEILDQGNSPVDILPNVTGGNVNHNMDRTPGMRTCSVSWIATPSSVDPDPFISRIRPWRGIVLTDGSVVEWPLGVFLAVEPERSLVDSDTYELTMDMVEVSTYHWQQQTYGLSQIDDGTEIGTAISDVIEAAGLTPSSDIADSNLTTPALTPGETFWKTVTALCETADFYVPYTDPFNGDVKVKAKPDVLSDEQPDVIYGPTVLNTDTKLRSRDIPSNRVVVRATNPGVEIDAQTVVANDIDPTWPYTGDKLGFYIDASPIDDDVSTSTDELTTTGKQALSAALRRYRRIEPAVRIDPRHEAFDIISFRYGDDPDFGTQQVFLERGWTVDFTDSTMKLVLARWNI